VFQIRSGAVPPADLKTGDIHSLTIDYSPTSPFQETEYGFDVDTIIVRTSCAEFKAIVRGQGVQSSISISDFLNNTIRPGESICTDQKPTGNITVSNFGTNEVTIYGVEKIEDMINGVVVYQGDAGANDLLTDWADIDARVPEFTIPTDGNLPLDFGLMIIPASGGNNPANVRSFAGTFRHQNFSTSIV